MSKDKCEANMSKPKIGESRARLIPLEPDGFKGSDIIDIDKFFEPITVIEKWDGKKWVKIV